MQLQAGGLLCPSTGDPIRLHSVIIITMGPITMGPKCFNFLSHLQTPASTVREGSDW